MLYKWKLISNLLIVLALLTMPANRAHGSGGRIEGDNL